MKPDTTITMATPTGVTESSRTRALPAKGFPPRTLRSAVIAALPSLQEFWCAYKERRLRSMRDTFISQFGLAVRNGPFEGLLYLPESSCFSLIPKLLGSYEAALHPIFAELTTNRYDNIINVGCAEGYYAVGLARRCPDTPVVAFDSDRAARSLCKRTAQLNRVTRNLAVRGECHPEVLAAVIGNRSLIVCDCEGDEARLLDPFRVPGLERCDLIVELHASIDPDIPGLIATRFQETHSVRVIRENSALIPLPEIKAFTWFDRPLATYEERAGAEALWAVLKSKDRN